MVVTWYTVPCEGSSPAVTICHPNVHLLGDDAACIAYTRLIQVMTKYVYYYYY